eukprot:COSAG02_NODE_19886_length_860_cov_1.145861_1_plen_143_part_01
MTRVSFRGAGNPLAASNFHETVCDMKGKLPPYTLPYVGGGISSLFASEEAHQALKKEMAESSVSLHEFTRWCQLRQSRHTVGTYAFFLQTFSLIWSHSAEISVLEVINFDVGRAAKTCRLPGCGLLCSMSGMAVVPIGASMTV